MRTEKTEYTIQIDGKWLSAGNGPLPFDTKQEIASFVDEYLTGEEEVKVFHRRVIFTEWALTTPL
jgi:hypothetical protein